MSALAAAAIVITGMAALAADQSPEDNPDDSFEIEPPLLIPNRSDEPLAVAPSGAVEGDPARLEKELARAKERAAPAERFCRIGALSRVEVEQRALKVVRLEAALANARLALAQEELVTQQGRLAAGEISEAELAKAAKTVGDATESVETAAANLQRAELEAAEANLHRQRKLLATRTARKSDVSRAEQKIAELKAQKN